MARIRKNLSVVLPRHVGIILYGVELPRGKKIWGRKMDQKAGDHERRDRILLWLRPNATPGNLPYANYAAFNTLTIADETIPLPNQSGGWRVLLMR